MAEMIDIFTDQEVKIGTISKKEYYTYKGDNIPWIKCATCYVVNNKNKKIILEKRGERHLDPGKIDACSGHVRSGELPLQCMVRELGEELNIPEQYASKLHYLGKIKVNWVDLEDEALRQRLKAFVDIYALRLQDTNMIKKDGTEVAALAEATYDETKRFIESNKTRFPYTRSLKPQYDEILGNLEDYIFSKNKTQERVK